MSMDEVEFKQKVDKILENEIKNLELQCKNKRENELILEFAIKEYVLDLFISELVNDVEKRQFFENMKGMLGLFYNFEAEIKKE